MTDFNSIVNTFCRQQLRAVNAANARSGVDPERVAVARNLRILADECIDKIDGATEARGNDSWLTTLADGMRHAAILLEDR